MESSALKAVLVFGVIAVSGAGTYALFQSEKMTSASPIEKEAYSIVAGSLDTGPVSDKVNFETQSAAIAAFEGKADTSLAKAYLPELKQAVSDGKGAYYLATFVGYFPKFGVSRTERDAFMASLPPSSDRNLEAIKLGWKNETRLRTSPLKYSVQSVDGRSFDVASLRGKIVLLDFWDTGCSACIEAMPRIEKSYQAYRARGFEVVSIAFEDTSGNIDANAISRIKKETGATWPLSFAAAKQWDKLAATYGYTGRPQYMLLDRQGKLIAATGEIDLARNLDTLLQDNM